MTISHEARKLRSEVVALGEGTGRKYSVDLRRRILSWVDRAVAAGWCARRCGKDIDVPHHRFDLWREYEKRPADWAPRPTSKSSNVSKVTEPAGNSLALVPLTICTTSAMSTATLITPNGYRVEGLTIEQLAALLRELP